MKKLDVYILKKYLSSFLLAIALIIVIVITFDVSEKMDDFLQNHAPLQAIVFQYYLTFVPNFVNLYSPLFVFISVIFFTGKMAANTEIIAILGSGVSYARMLKPYLYGAAIVAALVTALGNFVIPLTNRTQNEFDRNYIHTHSMRRNYYSNIHFMSAPGKQVYAESFEVKQQAARNFRQETYEGKKMVRCLAADNLVFDSLSRQWTATEMWVREMKGDEESLTRHVDWKGPLDVVPDDFFRAKKIVYMMTTPELHSHIRNEELRGSGLATEAKIELYQRLLNPIAIFVMTFIGVAVSSRKTRGGIGMHLAIGIALAFAFIVMMKITTVFSFNGSLTPFVAVLLPQVVFGIAALYLIKTAPK
ncbi:MAG: LptF/LptG family permease [Bacteroidales bacterium]|nr:LptF/LptG family permease [Bacteroidales bacterium]